VASTLIGLTIAEIVLRMGIDYLPVTWSNELGSGYSDYGDGIYRFDPELNMDRMRPHYERKMFFNGYHWHHRTDWMGFRNPTDRRRVDVALIGDSMIYGHGLEEPQTVSSHLERLLNRPVANLAEQGGAMDYEYEILKHDAVRLHPRYVFIFFLNNDITDVEGRLSDAEMRRFLELPLGDHTTRYFRLKHIHRHKSNFAISNFYVARSWFLLEHLVGARFAQLLASWHQSRAVMTAAGPAPSSAAAMPKNPAQNDASASEQPAWMTQPPFAGDPRMQLAIQFHLHAILKAKDFADRHGIRLAYVFIAVPLPYDSLYEGIIANYCRANGISFFSLRPALDDAQRAGMQVYLPADGHFSDAGAAITADVLADHFHLRDPTAWR
jgi:SGNH hydrolase-like domain, acetyltransferase AlgX